MTTFHTLTGDLADLAGVDLPIRITLATVSTNLNGAALVDYDNDTLLMDGPRQIDLAADGTFTETLVATNSTGTNVPDGSLRYKVTVYYKTATGTRLSWSSGYFELTSDTDLSNVAGSDVAIPVDPGPAPALLDAPTAANINDPESQTAAALAALEILRESTFNVLKYGADPTGLTDSAPAWQAAVDDAHASWLDGKGGMVYGPAGSYLWESQVTMPSFTTTGNNWDEDNPLIVRGRGENLTHIRYTGSDPYALAHATMGGTTNRGQNYGVEIAHFTLTGPQSYLNGAHGIGIDNTRFVDIHHVAFRGFPGGNFIHLYGHQKGGIFGGRIHRCRFGNSVNDLTASLFGGYKLYDPATMEKWAARYAIHLDGPYDTTGKVNDIEISSNQVYDTLIGCVKVEGHGTWTPGTNTGSSANTFSTANVYFMAGSRKIEEAVKPGTTSDAGTLTGTPTTTVVNLQLRDDGDHGVDDDIVDYNLAIWDGSAWVSRTVIDYVAATRQVTVGAAYATLPVNGDRYRLLPPGGLFAVDGTNPTTVMQLRQGQVGGALAGTTFLNGDDDLNGYYLALQDEDGRWHRRYITDFVGATRTVTVGSAFPFTPVIGNNYRVGYADDQAQADFPNPIGLQHAFRWASSYSLRSVGDYFEESRWLVAHANANSNVTFVNPLDVVNDVSYALRDDGSKWFPRLSIADRPRASDAIPASLMITDQLWHHPELANGEFGPRGRLTNSTGARIYPGDTLRVLTNGQAAGVSQATNLITAPHVVVADNWRTFYDPGEEFPYALGGVWKVKVNGACTLGDLLVPTTGNICFPVSPLALTSFDTDAEVDTPAEVRAALTLIATAVRNNRFAVAQAMGSLTAAGKVRALFRAAG